MPEPGAVPPVAEMLRMGIPVSAGTDATRVASYNPWVCLHWLVTGKTAGGTPLYPDANLLSREQALRLYTQAGTWFSSEEGTKGTLQIGRLADLVVLSDDFFSVSADQIKQIESLLMVVGGEIVYATESFAPHGPPALPVSPGWSPVDAYGSLAANLRQCQVPHERGGQIRAGHAARIRYGKTPCE